MNYKNIKKDKRWGNIKYGAVQEWLPFESVSDDGIIKLKDESYIKILKIIPINFNLKSDFEKEAILNSYKLFLKTCNFNFQILIQSNKENINDHINKIKKNFKINSENNIKNKINLENENQIKNKIDNLEKIKNIANNYCEYIKKLNHDNSSSSKKFFILIKKNSEKITPNSIKEELNSDYFKVKECLARCGNTVLEVSSKKETMEILYSFLNTKDYIKKY